MLSKAKIKFVKSLQIKKYRKQEQCFVVEGVKSVQELLASDFEVILLLVTNEFRLNNRLPESAEIIEVTDRELAGIGEFQSNDSVLAVARMQSQSQLVVEPNEYALVLDDIRDPGNLGTIIRTADWFGISKIIASEETADGLMVTFNVRNESELLQWLLGWGRHVQVLEPESLKMLMIEETQAILYIYKQVESLLP